MILREERIGDQRLILGDCHEVMPSLDRMDAVVSDPPYGIDFDFSRERNSRKSGLSFGKGRSGDDIHRGWSRIAGDDRAFDPLPFLHHEFVILWGGNNYAGLPPSRGWLVWDKRRDTTPDNHGDAELAWTNIDMVVRVHRQVWRGIVREGVENVTHGPKHHPTQKPLALMEWCLGFIPEGKTILDPFMGSGTTLVACQRMGRKGVGIELDPVYFDSACKRVDEVSRQGDLFVTSGSQPQQAEVGS